MVFLNTFSLFAVCSSKLRNFNRDQHWESHERGWTFTRWKFTIVETGSKVERIERWLLLLGYGRWSSPRRSLHRRRSIETRKATLATCESYTRDTGHTTFYAVFLTSIPFRTNRILNFRFWKDWFLSNWRHFPTFAKINSNWTRVEAGLIFVKKICVIAISCK